MRNTLPISLLLFFPIHLSAQTSADSFCIALTAAINEIPNNFEGIKGGTLPKENDLELFECTLVFPGELNATIEHYAAGMGPEVTTLAVGFPTMWIGDSLSRAAAVKRYYELRQSLEDCIEINGATLMLEDAEDWEIDDSYEDRKLKLLCGRRHDSGRYAVEISLRFIEFMEEEDMNAKGEMPSNIYLRIRISSW